MSGILLAAKHMLEWKYKLRRDKTVSTGNPASLLALFHDYSFQVVANLLLWG